MEGRDQHVDAYVGLEAVQKEGGVNVAAGDAAVVADRVDEGRLALAHVARPVQKDAAPAVGRRGLENPHVAVPLRLGETRRHKLFIEAEL